MTQGNIEAKNAREEILEIVERCNKCGLCKAGDTTFRALREESVSSRGRCILFSENIFDKAVFDDPLSGTCKKLCPLGINIDNALRKARKMLNLRNKGLKENKDMLKKIKEGKNPFVD